MLEKKVVSAIMLTLLLVISMLTLALNIQPVKASATIYIRADGSIDPPDAPIRRDGDIYTLTGGIINVTDGIVIYRSNVVLDGAGHVLQGTSGPWDSGWLSRGEGVLLQGVSNITIRNMETKLFNQGVFLGGTSDISIYGNNITDGIRLHGCLKESYVFKNSIGGVHIDGCSNNWIFENNMHHITLVNSSSNEIYGNNMEKGSIGLGESSNHNSIFGNNITGGGISLGARASSNMIIENNICMHANGCGISLSSDYNYVFGNNITNNGYGIQLEHSSNNSISGNNITATNYSGIYLYDSSNYNSISGNNIRNNNGSGVELDWYSGGNTVSGNNIVNNEYGVTLEYSSPPYSSDNRFNHNNFIDNTQQVSSDGYANIWDDGYPSGGNYWSDSNGTDLCSGAYQNETGSDGIGDIPYEINENNIDRYPLMHPWTPEHDLAVSIVASSIIMLGGSSSLEAIVRNLGRNDEVGVEFLLLIDGTVVNSTTIPLLQATNSYMLSHLWTPTVEGTYNITAYANPVLEETSAQNNQITRIVIVAVSPPSEVSPLSEVQVGVRAGDWIKVEYTISGWPAGQPYPGWLKVEFLSVEGTNATVRVTMHMSDGTQEKATVPVDVVAGGQALGLSGFVVPANLTTGNSVYITGYGNVTIAGETTRTYAEASRTVVYASFSQYGTQLTYYWDKHTGVMVEASTTSGGVTATAKATETNMWQAQKFGLPINPTVFYALIIVAIVVVAALAFHACMIRRRKKLPEEIEPPKS